MLVLIADPADEDAIAYLRGSGIEVLFVPAITPSELLEEIPKIDALMVRSRTKVTKEVIEKAKNLKVVARIGSGFDNIDVSFCKEKGITVVNAPDANSQAVAELTIALILSFLRKIHYATSSMKEGLWVKSKIWGRELFGKTVGVLGYGYVGKRVVNILSAFGCQTLVFSKNYQTANLEEIFRKSDIITVHLTLSDQTRGLITAKYLALMKKDALIVNIGRGELIKEEDLFKALKDKKIGGAVLDVYWLEPLPAGSPWRKLDNVILTPHIGAATVEALKKASMTVAQDVVRVLKGEKARNQVIY